VGYKRSRGLDTPLAEHWDGLSWSRVEIPGIGPTVSGRFADVAVVSSGDIWLAGYVTKGKRSSGVLLHWNGGSWTFTPPIAFPLEDRNYGSAYHALLAIAHDDVWAVANAYTRSAAPLVAAHWDGVSWRAFKLPVEKFVSTSEVNELAAAGRDDVWAVGDVYAGGGDGWDIAVHWNGKNWKGVSTATADSGCLNEPTLTGVAAVSQMNVWTVGHDNDCNLFVEHWNGHRWRIGSRRGIPHRAELVDLDLQSGTLWAFGTRRNNRYGAVSPLVARWTGSQWLPLPTIRSPGGVRGLSKAEVIAPTHIWAIAFGASGAETIVRYGCS